MSGSSRFVGNALFNLFGGVAPAVVTLLTIPFIVSQLGTSHYGVLTLITSIIGYFAILDINVTAGAVKFISEHHAKGDDEKVFETLTFGFIIYLVIGVAGMCGIWLMADTLITSLFKIPQDAQKVSFEALQWAALGFLFGQLQAYLQSVPQALQRYDISGRVEAAFGVMVPLATVGLLIQGMGLVEIVVLRVCASALHCAVLCLSIRSLLPGLRFLLPSRTIRAGILSFSAYSFLSRLAAITYSHADKLLIGALAGVDQVTYFAVAATLANRILSLTARLSSVVFPTASSLAARQRMDVLERLYMQSSRYLFFINGSVVLLLAVFSFPILSFWMGSSFAAQGAMIMAIVAVAQFIDALTNIPSLVNDGLGNPKVSGLFALTRAAVGLALLYVLIIQWGSGGAAWAHLIASVIMTTAFLAYVHGRTVPFSFAQVVRLAYVRPLMALAISGVVCVVLRGLADDSLMLFLACGTAASLVLAVCGGVLVVLPQHRQLIANRLRRLLKREALE